MSFPFRKALDAEIDRLKAEKQGAERRKKELTEKIDRHIALLDERLNLAMRLSEAYERDYPRLSFVQRYPVLNPTVESPNLVEGQTALPASQPAPDQLRVAFTPILPSPAPEDTTAAATGTILTDIPDLTEAEWAAVQPLLVDSFGRNDRRLIAGILWAQRTGLGYRKIPGSDGKWTTFYNRFRAWEQAGMWDRIVKAIDAVGENHPAHPGPPKAPLVNPANVEPPKAAAPPLDEPELTWADVKATELPRMVDGRRLRPDSKKAQIIQATIAFLSKEKFAARWRILQALAKLGITKTDNASAVRLSVILSQAREIFGTYRPPGVSVSGWYLEIDTEEDEDVEKH